MSIPSLTMNTGATMPQIGYGLWRIEDKDECKSAIKAALDAGFNHFDDAQVYGNEHYLGEALQEAGAPRDELFITTKIWTENMVNHNVEYSFQESLEKLQMEYVDLLLLHFPVSDVRQDAWRKLEAIHKNGAAKAIGVSNYTVRHLEEMAEYGIQPAVNQVELSVVLQQPDLVRYCQDNNIIVQAYTPLAEGHFFDDTTLLRIAEKYHKTVPQIMLRWCIDYGVVALTKSAKAERIRQNIDIFDFELSDSDMEELSSLDQKHRTNWDPSDVE